MRGLFRFGTVLCLLVLLSFLLAACGDSSDEPSPTPTDPPASATADPTLSPPPPATETSVSGPDATTTGEADATETTPDAPTEPVSTIVVPADPTATTPGEVAGPTPPIVINRDFFALGWNVALRGDDGGAEHNERTVQAVQDSGFGWVRFQMSWAQFESQPNQWDPLPYDRTIDELHQAGVKILLVVAKAPDWALDTSGQTFLANYGEFEEFMAFVAERYAGKVQAWEIWNEQNLAYEVNGQVRVGDYVELLKAGYRGVKAADSGALVVFGGLTPNGVNDPAIAIDDKLYLEQIYAYNGGEIRDYYDIMGVHLNSTHNSPDQMWPDNPGPEGWNDHESFYFRRAEQLRRVMIDNGDAATTMWITEFGWTTENQAPGYEYGVNNTEEDVAEYLVRSLEIAQREWDFVSGAFVWNLNWSTLSNPEDEIYPWSALNADWSPRPAYLAMQAYPKE
jgi:hypothetical protein